MWILIKNYRKKQVYIRKEQVALCWLNPCTTCGCWIDDVDLQKIFKIIPLFVYIILYILYILLYFLLYYSKSDSDFKTIQVYDLYKTFLSSVPAYFYVYSMTTQFKKGSFQSVNHCSVINIIIRWMHIFLSLTLQRYVCI